VIGIKFSEVIIIDSRKSFYMTIIEQLVNDFKAENPSASPEQIKEYLQSIQQHTKVIKEDEYAFNTPQDTDSTSPVNNEVHHEERS
jgi:hypothetical protein